MNKVLNFTKLDLFTVKPYLTWKVSLLFLGVCAGVGTGTGETAVVVGMCMIYAVIFSSYPFAVGEKNALDTLYATLPVNKKQMVAGRYLFSICLTLTALILSCILSFILMTVLGKAFDLIITLMSALVCFLLFSLIEAIQMPIYFKFGYTKAKFLTYIPLMAFPLATVIVSTLVGKNELMPLVTDIMAWIEANMALTTVLCIVLWACIMLLSGMLSYRFYKKREF